MSSPYVLKFINQFGRRGRFKIKAASLREAAELAEKAARDNDWSIVSLEKGYL